MIRVVITSGASMGRFNYRIETEGTRLAAPYYGLSALPLLDACGVLRNLRVASDGAVVGLFPSRASSDCMGTAKIGWIDRLISDGTPATPEEPPQPPSRSAELPADRDQGASGPGRPVRSPRKRKPAGSGARQGRRYFT